MPAGVSLKSNNHNPSPIQHGAMGQTERTFSVTSTFVSGIMAILASQLAGAPLKFVDPLLYDRYMAWTKECFAVLMTTITQWWAPTVVRVSGDDSMRGQFYQMKDGTLRCNFPHRLVLTANHQLYTDWLYLWWIAYANNMHGRIYIVLKESLKRVPIIGWGMQFYNFIFLSRNWAQDRTQFKEHLHLLQRPQDPMWLMIFPEGTNLSAETREKSAAWSVKAGIPDMKHQLLPRTTGLQFCLREMQATTNWLYDCTIAYEGIPPGMYGQDIFTLRSSFFEGRPPKSVNMFWRRFRIVEIPLHNDEAFVRWLVNRWREKDYMLEYFYKFGSFPSEKPVHALAAVRGNTKPIHAKAISTFIKGGGWDEFLGIFGPITTVAGALSNVDLTEPLCLDDLARKLGQSQQLNIPQISQRLTPSLNPRVLCKFLDERSSQPPDFKSTTSESPARLLLPPPLITNTKTMSSTTNSSSSKKVHVVPKGFASTPNLRKPLSAPSSCVKANSHASSECTSTSRTPPSPPSHSIKSSSSSLNFTTPRKEAVSSAQALTCSGRKIGAEKSKQ